MVFSERIEKRWALWWGPPHMRGLYAYRALMHRLKERYTVRDRNDGEPQWQCCELWRRTLIYKRNARAFAQKHGCRVPTLYWFGRKVSSLPFASLPDYYVMKPNLGFSRNGVYVMAGGRELLSQGAYTEKQLKDQLWQLTGGIFGLPILVEEFVTTEDGEYQLPVEYKCHVFGETVGAIQVIQRSGDPQHTRQRFYTAQWKLFEDQMWPNLPPGTYIDPPQCLEEMLTLAKKLGKAYGAYVRVDFYASEKGCVFGEFSSTPARGRGFTTYADDYFGTLWQENLADEI